VDSCETAQAAEVPAIDDVRVTGRDVMVPRSQVIPLE